LVTYHDLKESLIAPHDLGVLLESVLQARKRVMLEVNVHQDRAEELIKILPCMREPTVSPLHGGLGYAVKAAVPKDILTTLIPMSVGLLLSIPKIQI